MAYALRKLGVESLSALLTPTAHVRLYRKGPTNVEQARKATSFWVAAYSYATMRELLACMEPFKAEAASASASASGAASASALGPAAAAAAVEDPVQAMIRHTSTREFRLCWQIMMLNPDHPLCLRAHSIAGLIPPPSDKASGAGRSRSKSRTPPTHGSVECFNEIRASLKGLHVFSFETKTSGGAAARTVRTVIGNKGVRVLPIDTILETHEGLFELRNVAQKVAAGYAPDATDADLDVDLDKDSDSEEHTDAEGDRMEHEPKDAPAKAVKVVRSGGMSAEQHLKMTELVYVACEMLDKQPESSKRKMGFLHQKLLTAQANGNRKEEESTQALIRETQLERRKLVDLTTKLRSHLIAAAGTNLKTSEHSRMGLVGMLTAPIPEGEDAKSATQKCLQALRGLVQASAVVAPLLMPAENQNQKLPRLVIEDLHDD